MAFPNFHLFHLSRCPGEPLEVRNQEKLLTFVKSVVEQGSEGAVTPRVNVRRPEEEEEGAAAAVLWARLHRRSFTTDPALSSCKARLPFIISTSSTILYIITSISSIIFWVTHIFRSVLRSVRPAAEPA